MTIPLVTATTMHKRVACGPARCAQDMRAASGKRQRVCCDRYCCIVPGGVVVSSIVDVLAVRTANIHAVRVAIHTLQSAHNRAPSENRARPKRVLSETRVVRNFFGLNVRVPLQIVDV